MIGISTRHILWGCSQGPSHGYDLKRPHDERFPGPPFAYGQVSTTSSAWCATGSRRSTAPTRTAVQSGRSTRPPTTAVVVADWVRQISAPAPHVVNEIFAKVVVAILAGGDPAAYLLDQRAAHMARMRELTAVKTAPGSDLSTVLSADYALNHLDAELRWMTTTVARLTTLTAEVDTA